MLFELIIFAVVFAILSAVVNLVVGLTMMKYMTSEKFVKWYAKTVKKMTEVLEDEMDL